MALSLFFRRFFSFFAAAGVMLGMSLLAYIKDSTNWSIICMLSYIIVFFIYTYVPTEGNIFSRSSDAFEVAYQKRGGELPYNSPMTTMKSVGAMNIKFRIENSVTEKFKEKASTSSAMVFELKKETKQQCKEASCAQMSGREMNVPLTLKSMIANSLMEKVKQKTSTCSAVILEPKIETKQQCKEATLYNSSIGIGGAMDVPLILKIENFEMEKDNEKTSIGSAIVLEPKKTSISSAIVLEPKTNKKRRCQEAMKNVLPMESGERMNVKLRIKKSSMEKENNSMICATILNTKMKKKRQLMLSSDYETNEYLASKRLKVDDAINNVANYCRSNVEEKCHVNNEAYLMTLDIDEINDRCDINNEACSMTLENEEINGQFVDPQPVRRSWGVYFDTMLANVIFHMRVLSLVEYSDQRNCHMERSLEDITNLMTSLSLDEHSKYINRHINIRVDDIIELVRGLRL